MWVNTEDLPTSDGHPFFERLNRVLEESGFDAFVEGLCEAFYACRLGRPSLRPGRYFRLLFIGYFEGVSSERGIAWRVADSSSWLNMVERFFRTLTDRQIRRGVFTSVKELEARLAEYIDTYNENPQPFVWTKSAKQILEKVGRARQTLGHHSA